MYVKNEYANSIKMLPISHAFIVPIISEFLQLSKLHDNKKHHPANPIQQAGAFVCDERFA